MAALINQVTAPHLTDFIDAVRKLVTAVFYGDFGVAARQIAAVDIGDAGHGDLFLAHDLVEKPVSTFPEHALIDSERLELAVKRRAFHTDEFSSARNVAAKAADLRDEIFALEHLARVP
jgi:hypothetical protein